MGDEKLYHGGHRGLNGEAKMVSVFSVPCRAVSSVVVF